MTAQFFVRRGRRDDAPSGYQVVEASSMLSTGESDFREAFGAITTLESDLLLLAASVFAADRASQRGEREDFYRTIHVSVPITNISRLLPLRGAIETVLRKLSDDGWTIELRPHEGAGERRRRMPKSRGRTLLFSGGLDSLAAAVEFSSSGKLQLVSHRTHNNVVTNAQRQLAEQLVGLGRDVTHHQFFVSSRSGGPSELRHADESSQRTRSFVFLVLGALAARRAHYHEVVYLAENGQMAIHLPLNAARIGAFSTHTARPDVLLAMQDLLSRALGFPLSITNPYVHRTKREVIVPIIEVLPEALIVANSCWRNARLPAGVTHCGACVPCYVRRVAIESFGADATPYERDVWSEDVSALAPTDDGRRNLADFCEFVIRFSTATNEEIMSNWPELYDDTLDSGAVIAMYRRFAAEALAVMRNYPRLRAFLQ